MTPARLETLCFLYAGVVFTATGSGLLATTGSLSWLVTFGTGPIFFALGVYWLRNPSARTTVPTEYGPRIYAILALALLSTLTSLGLLSLRFA
jgi:hypothetical protein